MATDYSKITPTAPGSTTTVWRGQATGVVGTPVSSAGLALPPTLTDPRYTEYGLGQVAPQAIQTASYTAAAAGGAPGATFGAPGTAGAAVTTTAGLFGLSPLGLGLLIVGAGIAAYLVLK